jgi:hypothetical protein
MCAPQELICRVNLGMSNITHAMARRNNEYRPTTNASPNNIWSSGSNKAHGLTMEPMPLPRGPSYAAASGNASSKQGARTVAAVTGKVLAGEPNPKQGRFEMGPEWVNIGGRSRSRSRSRSRRSRKSRKSRSRRS